MIPLRLGDIAQALLDQGAHARQAEGSEASPGRSAPNELEIRRFAQNDSLRHAGERIASAIIIRRVTTDSREVQPGDLFVAIRGPNHDGHAYIPQAAERGAVACLVDRTGAETIGSRLAIPTVVVADTVAALGQLAAYYRQRMMPVSTTVIAVTGSNGKTTTKNMIDHVLHRSLKGFASPRSFNNQFGVPLTLLMASADDQYVVSEIGTNACGEVAHLAAMARPHVGVITSIGEAHLEGLGGIEGVAQEKASLLDHVQPGGLAVVNIDRPQIRAYVERFRHARIVTVGTHPSAKLTVKAAESTLWSTAFELEGRYRIELPMPGSHHATNAAAAFAVARWLGVDCGQIIEALRTFVPANGRTRRIEANGLTIIDDAYNANPASVAAAVDAMTCGTRRRRVFVLGDMRELGKDESGLHDRVVRRIADSGIEVLVGVGEAMKSAVEKLPNGHLDIHLFADADEACQHLDDVVRDGDAVWIKGSRAVQLDKVVRALTEPRPSGSGFPRERANRSLTVAAR